jgi:hypothetical protein
MKNDQKNMTIPNTHSVHLSHAPSMLNMKPSPSVSSVRNAKRWENIPGCFPPSPVTCSTATGHP